MAKSPIGKAAFWSVMATFVSVVVGGWSFGHHLQVLGLVFAALAGPGLVALFGIGVIAAVSLAPKMVRQRMTIARHPGWAAPPRGYPAATPESYGPPRQSGEQQPAEQPQPFGQPRPYRSTQPNEEQHRTQGPLQPPS